jgi:hypothetical protein
VTAGVPTFTFTSKVVIQEQLANGTMVSVDGGSSLQIDATNGGSGTGKLGITLQNKKGGLWFSSNWSGTKTIMQTIDAGNIVGG